MGSKYEPEVKERVLALYASGMTALKVAKQVGVPYSTALDWIHTAQDEDEDFVAARREAKRRAINKAWQSVQLGINAINRQVANEILQSSGVSVEPAGDGLEAVEKLWEGEGA